MAQVQEVQDTSALSNLGGGAVVVAGVLVRDKKTVAQCSCPDGVLKHSSGH